MSISTPFTFISEADGLKLSALSIAPEGEIKGIVQLVHGMCEYKERYIPFMEFLAKNGYYCVIHDHRGHGKSIKENTDLGYFYADGAANLVEDIHQLTKLTKSRIGVQYPYILLGHSMGSLAVRCYMKKYDKDVDKLLVVGSPSNLAITGVGLVIVKMIKAIKGERKHSKFIDSLCMGNYEKRYKEENTIHSWISSDKAVVEKYNADPFCNYTFTLNGYEALVTLQKVCYEKKNWAMSKPEMPICFFSGEGDPCAVSTEDFYKSVKHMEECGYKNVSSKLYKNMRHEILNEIGKEEVYHDMLQFIEG